MSKLSLLQDLETVLNSCNFPASSYFDEDDDDTSNQPLYQPGPDSPNFAGGTDI